MGSESKDSTRGNSFSNGITPKWPIPDMERPFESVTDYA